MPRAYQPRPELWLHDLKLIPNTVSFLVTGEAIPLEYNLDGLNAISFTKGCYMGQELVARTHFRGMVRKRLMPIVLVPHAGANKVQGNATCAE